MHLWKPIDIWQIEFVLIWIYSKGSEYRFVVVQHFWCRKIYKIVCRVPRKRVKSKFLYQDADVILLADKCIVVRSFVCRNYDKVLIETGKFSDNLRVTESGIWSRFLSLTRQDALSIAPQGQCIEYHLKVNYIHIPTMYLIKYSKKWKYNKCLLSFDKRP